MHCNKSSCKSSVHCKEYIAGPFDLTSSVSEQNSNNSTACSVSLVPRTTRATKTGKPVGQCKRALVQDRKGWSRSGRLLTQALPIIMLIILFLLQDVSDDRVEGKRSTFLQFFTVLWQQVHRTRDCAQSWPIVLFFFGKERCLPKVGLEEQPCSPCPCGRTLPSESAL